MEPRIAILGSCITRDLWPVRGGGAERLLYISRTSFPSLFSPAVTGFMPAEGLPGDLHAHEHAALVADLRKTALGRLVAFQPTHLIFDFIDERFDLLVIGNALASHSGEMARSGYLEQPALAAHRRAPRLSPACERIWAAGVAEFAALVRHTPLTRARRIHHRARWASHLRRPDGATQPITGVEIVLGQPAEIDAYNALLARQEAIFARAFGPMDVVQAEGAPLADPDHRWGLSPFHYTADYYDQIRAQLMGIDGLAEAFSSPRAAADRPDGPRIQAA
jgi:hypothetical protein